MRIPITIGIPFAALLLAVACASTPAGAGADVQRLQAQLDNLNRELLLLQTAADPDQPRLMGEYWGMLQKQLQDVRNMPGVASHNCKDWILVAPSVYGGEPVRAINPCPSLHEAAPPAGWALPAGMTPRLFRLTMRQQLDRLQAQVSDIASETDPRERLDLVRAHYETRYQDIQAVLGRGWMWTPPNPLALPDPYSMGAGAFMSYCSQCHQPPPPALHTASEWRGITGRMRDIIRVQSQAQTMGIRMPSPDEFDLISAYLEAHANGTAGSGQ